MKSNRLWAIGTTIIVVAVVALGWLLGISPKLAEASSTSTTADQVDAENLSLQQQIVALKAAYENIDLVREELEDLEKSLPPSAGIPDFIRQLNTIATANGVRLDAIATDEAHVYEPQTASTIPEVVTATAAMGTQNLILIPITLRMTGGAASILAFNEALQTGDRLFLVTNLVIQNGISPTDPDPIVTIDGEEQPPPPLIFSGEVSGFIFVVLNPNAPVEDLEEEEPAEEPTPTPTPTPTEPTPTPTETVAALRR